MSVPSGVNFMNELAVELLPEPWAAEYAMLGIKVPPVLPMRISPWTSNIPPSFVVALKNNPDVPELNQLLSGAAETIPLAATVR